DGKVHDVNILDLIAFEAGSFYVMDRAYVDFTRLYSMNQQHAFFVTRAKSNLKFRRIYSHPIDKATGLKCDQTITLTGVYTSKQYPDKLRRIKFHDAETGKILVFLTNNFTLPPIVITELYRSRWQVELFFKWIKQNLRIKAFYGTTENAVKTQIWIAVSVYVLVAIIKKRLNTDMSLYTMLQILSITIFEKIPLNQLFKNTSYENTDEQFYKQLKLFN
ncbi:MAG: IS4 family transposase, partial [Desulfosalsimonas sp.]